jgi:ectoine hydroxylase-related dioxygenase (phytanoyl-CoA dioxygenase family)
MPDCESPMTSETELCAAASQTDTSLAGQYRSNGYVVLEEAVDPADLSAAAASIEQRQIDAGRVSRSDRYNKAGRIDFTKIPNLAKNDESFRRLASSPAVVQAVEALLEQQALLFRDVMVIKPARDGALLDYHQDSEYWDIEPRALVSAWFPFRTVEVEDGCLRVIPGSHLRQYPHDILLGESRSLPAGITSALRRMVSLAGTGDSDASGFSAARKLKNGLLGNFTRRLSFLAKLQDLHARIPEEEKLRAVNLPVRKGSVILFHSMLLHASNPNTSTVDRLAYIPSYMGSDYSFRGVGDPEFLVVGESASKIFKKIKSVKS